MHVSVDTIDFVQIGNWNLSTEFDVKKWNFQEVIQLVHNEYDRGGLFSWAVGADEKNSTHNIIQLDQGGLGLPSRDYYLNKTYEEVVNAYLTFMTRVGVLLGGEENSTRTQMEAVIEFERKLANITVPAEDRRDDIRIYHQIRLSDLQNLAPVIDWVKYFQFAFKRVNYVITPEEHIVVYSPEYLSNMSAMLQEYLNNDAGKIVVANYISWSVVQSLSSCLSKPFREAAKILRKALIGSEGTESPWRYCVSDTNNVMGFAMGAMFVQSVFKGDSKPMAESMIEEIKDAFKHNLPNLKWMDADTRKLAIEKADAITDMIGFPDFITDPKKLDEKYEGVCICFQYAFGFHLTQ
ncbi:Endothelin-converting enzyme 2-like protein [Leptotrombidium deliense]|uniref:Endothelin-converting enzyme 2-like protein n=1 Tax=Leptotrombidium deliense TaxID=299467 RepID=A0A443S2M3_9ACAR|nr:Endothelin-converting enzyme 2-like protein [Leptotrombidium deliense]